MGADFNFQVSLRDVTHPQPFPKSREGKKKYPPYKGGLKVGANCDYKVSLREVTHPNLPSIKGRSNFSYRADFDC